MKDGFEILLDDPMIGKGRRILGKMWSAAPAESIQTSRYHGQRRVLVMYGAGALWRQQAMRIHLEQGAKVVCLDLAYWAKEGAMRFSIGGMHPSYAHLDMTPNTGRDYPELREDFDPKGPIIVIGMSGKGRMHYGQNGPTWELEKLRELRERFPTKEILYRKKGEKPDTVEWAACNGEPIEKVLRGASLVVCRHSNSAVDACIAGVPVECEGGAAHWLYRHGTTPTPAARRDFLGRLAHWQYSLAEARECWAAIQRYL